MTENISISFRVRNKGGKSAGKLLESKAPKFDWRKFKNTPNAEEFVRKAYYSEIKKIIREIDEKKNKTLPSDLDSFDSVILRSLSFTKDEIYEWINSRDWSKATEVPNINELLPDIQRHLPELAFRNNPFSAKISIKLADKVIAAVADDPDPVADYLFSLLTNPRSNEDELLGL